MVEMFCNFPPINFTVKIGIQTQCIQILYFKAMNGFRCLYNKGRVLNRMITSDTPFCRKMNGKYFTNCVHRKRERGHKLDTKTTPFFVKIRYFTSFLLHINDSHSETWVLSTDRQSIIQAAYWWKLKCCCFHIRILSSHSLFVCVMQNKKKALILIESECKFCSI